MLETTMIYSYLGKFNHHNGLINNAPFRSPHHTISDVALVGGGTNPKPGEVSLAHNGVLFLDELPEFKRKVLEVLRQPLENREITISRSIGSVTFPSNIMLVAAMNPSPDGDYFRSAHSNQSFTQVQRYLSRLSQPLLDRIDLQIEVDAVKFEQLTQQKNKNEKSCIIRQRVINARKTQKLRQSKNNAQLSPIELKRYCNLNKESIELLKKATLKQHFSARGFTRLQKIARTIADLDRSSSIEINHVAEALQYRGIEKMKNFLN
jgi:magnesium chelatase family protein